MYERTKHMKHFTRWYTQRLAYINMHILYIITACIPVLYNGVLLSRFHPFCHLHTPIACTCIVCLYYIKLC